MRFADFTTITRSQTLTEPTNITQELWRAADDMLRHRLPPGHLPVRLVGMGIGGLDEKGPVQKLLFDQDQRQKHAGLDAAADQIRGRFGHSALRRAAFLPHDKTRKKPSP